jgi:hypothetical protein
MPKTATLVPRPGLVVRDPVTFEPLPEAGASKTLNAYWYRRLDDGDVSVANVVAADVTKAGVTVSAAYTPPAGSPRAEKGD